MHSRRLKIRFLISAGVACLIVAGRPTPGLAQSDEIFQTHSGDIFGPRASVPLRSKSTERHAHTGRPGVALPESPRSPTRENVDTDRPFWDWQHLTDDWGGMRPQLEERGITLDAELFWGLSTALNQRDRFPAVLNRELLNVDTTFDFEKLGLWSGGTAFISFQQQAGRHSQNYFGDFQGISNIDADDRTQIAQVWFEQTLWEGILRFKVGKVDANSEFAYVEHASEFINSSFGVSPTIFAMPTYPNPATSLNLFWQPVEALSWGVGLYDGEGISGVPTGSQFFRTRFAGGSNLFTISEATFSWNIARKLPGRIGLGGWYHNGDFHRFDGTTRAGTGGIYLVLDQRLWNEQRESEDDDQGIACSMQWGLTDPQVSEAQQNLSVACSWIGAIPRRDADVIGLGISIVELSNAPGTSFNRRHETVVESLYQISLTRFWDVSFDVQTIVNPGGAARNPLVVGTVRNVIRF